MFITGAGGGSTLIVIDSCIVLVPIGLVADKLTVLLPAATGVPDITPVAELKLKPAGNAPLIVNMVGLFVAVIV